MFVFAQQSIYMELKDTLYVKKVLNLKLSFLFKIKHGVSFSN